jgi:hypothetical protein
MKNGLGVMSVEVITAICPHNELSQANSRGREGRFWLSLGNVGAKLSGHGPYRRTLLRGAERAVAATTG